MSLRHLKFENQPPISELHNLFDAEQTFQELVYLSISFLNYFDQVYFKVVMALVWPYISYPSEQAGFWDPVTSTLNWCEEVR
jgi:hypothetical protein